MATPPQASTMARVGSELDHSPYFALCNVEDAYAHVGLYLIRLPTGLIIPAHDLFHGTSTPLGARAIGGYSPKSRVLVMYDETLDHAVIIGSAPRQLSDARVIIPDALVLRSRVGQFEDAMHGEYPANEESFSGNYSAGRPSDSLPGDWGYINDMGVAVFLGRLMASLKASDAAKIEAFWGDDLLRIAGYNYELFTSGSEESRLNDEGEFVVVRRTTPYPWEALGQGKRGSDVTRKAEGKLERGSEYASEEPSNDKQLIIPRVTELGGYLGDLMRRVVSAPPDDLEIEKLDAGGKTIHNGLLDEIRSSDGIFGVRSAKSIVFEKYALIPVPKQLAAQEDPNGDSVADGYKPAGDGVSVPEFVWDEANPGGVRQAQLFDCLAWIWNKYTCAGLEKHEKDWWYPNETDLTKMGSGAVYNKSFDRLQTQFMLDLPNFKTIKIDHRDGRGSIRYYQSRSLIAQLDDGTVVIEDGYGASIRMGGGSIFLDAPGDVWVKSGRSFVTWAAFDAILRAGNCAEVTSAKKDVRIKAEKNLHMLGGNSGQDGGILIESRSQGRNTASGFSTGGEGTQSRGIAIKCADGAIDLFGKQMYLGITDASGMLTIDGGDGRLFFTGDEIAGQCNLLFSMLVGENSLLAISTQEAIVSTRLRVGGNLTVAPANPEDPNVNVIIGGNLFALGQGIFDDTVATNAGFAAFKSPGMVGPLEEPIDFETTPQELGDGISQEVQLVNDRDQEYERQIRDSADTSPGNAEWQDKIRFSCRDSEIDLKLTSDSFLIFESRWQQMARTGSIGGQEEWDEPTVKGVNDEQTMPHPGYQAWTQWQSFATVETKNFTGGAAAARKSMTEKGGSPSKTSLSGGYKVVVKPSA